MRKKIIYQVENSLDLKLGESSIDLAITSAPIDILLDRVTSLFDWFDRCLSLDGVILLDIPGQYNAITINLWELERRSPFKFQWGIGLHDFYKKGDTQSLCAYARYDVSRPENVSYRKCFEREMNHPCEFDSVLISNLIKMFSEPYQTVLDPFSGTGTVPRIAYKLERNGIGLDRRCPFTNELP